MTNRQRRFLALIEYEIERQRLLSEDWRKEDPGGSVDNPHPGDYAASVLEKLLKIRKGWK
jgi:hypothetical protein